MHAFGTLTVLIVDDCHDTVESTSELLSLAGCTVQRAFTGEEGLHLAIKSQPDLILLDLRMPGMDGFELTRRLLACAPKKPPVLVAMTGCANDEDREATARAGFHLHLAKPVDPAILIGLVRRIQRAFSPCPASSPNVDAHIENEGDDSSFVTTAQ
jgi:CheY-like chemotaxis protein